jgi:hypothetical protein
MSQLLKLRTCLRLPTFVSLIATKRRAHVTPPALWLAATIISSFVPTFAQGLDNSHESPIHRALRPPVSVDAETIDVQFGRSHYNIPRNYLAGVTQARDANSYASFAIQVLLPDFAPRTSENAPQFDVVGWHNKFRALFEYGNHPRPQEEILDFYLKNAGMSKDDFRLVGSGYKLYENAKTWHVKFTPKRCRMAFCSLRVGLQETVRRFQVVRSTKRSKRTSASSIILAANTWTKLRISI